MLGVPMTKKARPQMRISSLIKVLFLFCSILWGKQGLAAESATLNLQSPEIGNYLHRGHPNADKRLHSATEFHNRHGHRAYGPYRPIIRYIYLGPQRCGYQVVISNGRWSRTRIIYHDPHHCAPHPHVEVSYGWDYLGTGYNARCMKYHNRKPVGVVASHHCPRLTYRWEQNRCLEVFRGGVRGVVEDEFCGELRYVYEKRQGAEVGGCSIYRGGEWQGYSQDQRLCGPQRFVWDEYSKCFEYWGDSQYQEVHRSMCSDLHRLGVGESYLKDTNSKITELVREAPAFEHDLSLLALRSVKIRLKYLSSRQEPGADDLTLREYRERNDFNTISNLAVFHRFNNMCGEVSDFRDGAEALHEQIVETYGAEIKDLSADVLRRRKNIEPILLCAWE